MKKITVRACAALSVLVGISACNPNPPMYQKKAEIKEHRGADNLQAQRWDFNLPNQEVWKIGYKVQNDTVNNFMWIPKGQNMGTWKQNITDKFIVDRAVQDKSPKDLMERAQQSSKAQCERVDWKTLSENSEQIIYEANTINCGKGGKESQHMVGRIERGQGGIYSLQYFAVQDILEGHLKQTMLNTIQDAKLVSNN